MKGSSLKTLVTIHSHNTLGRTGFESSQQTRMHLAQLAGISYLHIVTSPQTANYKSRFRSLGFTYGEVVSVGEVLFGVCAEKLDTYNYVYNLADGQSIQAFYDIDCLHRPVPMWIYQTVAGVYTEEQVLIQYLAQLSLEDYTLIRDESRYPLPQLRRFLNLKEVLYFEYIHYPVIQDGYLSVLSKRTQYLVANEQVALDLQELGFHAQFFPPMCVDENLPKCLSSSTYRYIWSSHFGEYKRFDFALSIMKELEGTGITLDVYGGSQEEFYQKCLEFGGCPTNVKYCGFTPSVPYSDYDGYLSTSVGEMFANACVEAMSLGLQCVVSDYPYPYVFYSEGTEGSVITNHSVDDYVATMLSLRDSLFDSTIQQNFIKRYAYSKWVPKLKGLHYV